MRPAAIHHQRRPPIRNIVPPPYPSTALGLLPAFFLAGVCLLGVAGLGVESTVRPGSVAVSS